ncbi:MAG TPA: hypothetical protein VK659_27770 [Asanoa sp.]|nr:hypothetical protein [Asanoa sp.]
MVTGHRPPDRLGERGQLTRCAERRFDAAQQIRGRPPMTVFHSGQMALVARHPRRQAGEAEATLQPQLAKS